MKSLCLLFLIATVCLAQQQPSSPPVWPNQFQISFSETMTYPVLGSSNTTGYYYYDWTNLQYRVDRASGSWDRYCGSVEKLSDTPCSHIVVNGSRYLWFPTDNYCCYCCGDADGCGVLSPNWLQTASFVAYNQTSDGYTLQMWNVQGLQSNYYYAIDGSMIPYEIDQVPNDIQYFNPSTYQAHISDPSIFNLPSSQCNTNNTCPFLSTCTAVRNA